MSSSSYYNSGQARQQYNPQQQPLQQQHHIHNGSASSSSLPAPSLEGIASPVHSNLSTIVDENFLVQDYRPPGIISSPLHPDNPNNKIKSDYIDEKNTCIANKKVQWVYNPVDGSVLKDHNGTPLSVDRLLATKPLRHELSTRPGPGNKKLTYISGDDVSRTLNDVFGFDGWNIDIQNVTREDSSKDPKTGKFTIVYTARVRLTHKASGAYKEDCGAGDSTDRSFATAIAHALKASITDAMKRAARHFGDKLGNSLYAGNFSINKAPVSLKDALDKYDIHRCNTKFGFQQSNNTAPSLTNAATANATAKSTMPPPPAPRYKQQSTNQQQQGVTAVSNLSNNYGNMRNQDNHKVAQQHQCQQPQPAAHNNSNGPNTSDRQCSAAASNPTSIRTSMNISQHHQQNTNSSNGGVQPHLESAAISMASPATSSTVARPTSSYGRRPTVGSINASNTTSSNVNPSGSVMSGQSFKTSNANVHSNSTEGQNLHNLQQFHQPISTINTLNSNTPHLNANASNNTSQPIASQTPSTHGGNSAIENYSSAQYKRPPLMNIAKKHNSVSGSSEIASKRPKQHHHNPYQQSYNGGRKSI